MSNDEEQGASEAADVYDGQALADADFSDAVLYEAKFRNANLDRADFYGADAGGASFEGSSLVATIFTKAKLQGSRFVSARASNASFEKADLTDAKLANVELVSANFERAFLLRTDFSGANLRQATFVHAGLRSTDLRNADLTNANLDNANFDRNVLLDDCVGLATVTLDSILVAGERLDGDAARAYLDSRSRRMTVTREELERFYLDEIAGRQPRPEVAAIFSKPQAAVDFRRVLGAPVEVVAIEKPAPNYSVRQEFALAAWPAFRFGVNVRLDGEAWGIGFTGGPASLPADLSSINAGEWTLSGLREAGVHFENEQTNGPDVIANATVGSSTFTATFKYGVLTSLLPVDL